ncbi:helix-turn-helix domain-containing protein [Streptomyces chattanoogensis]|uniref:helix-turn-helix domain-containing protein n=1 Tax=Streptomyces chattanoogensis TaxID=66876 RepID=UPI000A4E6474|nr:helix-turn-helix domain-containing protein [Streptomyces chattanoogensis]
MGNLGGTGELRPAAAGDAVAFVGMMQQLKERSGLTYRQLEQRAAERGAVLARSTLADALRRRALPRAEVVEAFIRACGGNEPEVHAWLLARQRIEDGPPMVQNLPRAQPGYRPQAQHGDRPPGQPRHGARKPHGKRRKPLLLTGAAALAALLVIVGVRLLIGDGAEPQSTAAAPLPTGEVSIRPASAPGLCVTDGRVLRAHRYRTVAVQRPCKEAVPPRTYLKVAGADRYRIQWDHPDEGTGCLVLLRDPALDGLLEPHDDCTPTGPAERFRVESAGKSVYRIRPGDGDDRCLAVQGGGGARGTVVRAERCTEADSQKFLIGPEE